MLLLLLLLLLGARPTGLNHLPLSSLPLPHAAAALVCPLRHAERWGPSSRSPPGLIHSRALAAPHAPSPVYTGLPITTAFPQDKTLNTLRFNTSRHASRQALCDSVVGKLLRDLCVILRAREAHPAIARTIQGVLLVQLLAKTARQSRVHWLQRVCEGGGDRPARGPRTREEHLRRSAFPEAACHVPRVTVAVSHFTRHTSNFTLHTSAPPQPAAARWSPSPPPAPRPTRRRAPACHMSHSHNTHHLNNSSATHTAHTAHTSFWSGASTSECNSFSTSSSCATTFKRMSR
jgi:hypothetical protein